MLSLVVVLVGTTEFFSDPNKAKETTLSRQPLYIFIIGYKPVLNLLKLILPQ